jgi:hypothetical protein
MMDIISWADKVCQLYCINTYYMETLVELPATIEITANSVLSQYEIAEDGDINDLCFFDDADLIKAVVKTPCFKFYKVYKNETAVIKVSANDLKPFQPVLKKIKAACQADGSFSLPANEFMFCGFRSQISAMEHAKKGALKYIGKLIGEGEKSADLLIKYRLDHYDDLNINLVDRNIRKLESKLASA